MSIPPPEPDLTPDELVQRARDMIPVLRERQEECERLGRLPDETSRDFLAAGFYRILQPRRFGGYELDLPTFGRVSIEIARGCSSSGWTYALVAGHPHMLSAFFSEECQIDVYGDEGDVRMPGNVRFTGEATPEEGGYRVTGAWDYVSGCDSATHIIIGAEVVGNGADEPAQITGILDAGACTIIDNWNVHGFRGTGSRRVVAEDVFLPVHRTIGSLFEMDLRNAPGRRVHPNPLYAKGPLFGLLFGEITAVAIGTARGALDLYEETLATRRTTGFPVVPMKEHPDYHRFYGEAVQLFDVAESAFLSAADDYMAWSLRDAKGGIEFGRELEIRLALRMQYCSKLAADAVDLMVRTGGSSALKSGAMMERYRRDMTMLMTHNAAQPEVGAGGYGRMRLQPPVPRESAAAARTTGS